MVRDVNQNSGPGRRTARSSQQRQLLVAASIFSVVLGTAYYLAQASPSNQTVRQKSAIGIAAVDDQRQDSQTTEAVAKLTPPVVTTETTEVAAVEATGRESTPAVTPAAARREKIQAQLASGEFGPALKTVEQAASAEEKTALLKEVSHAQMNSGEFEASAASIRSMPKREQRAAAQKERVSRQTLAGGQADFSSLIDLIQTETGGPDSWSDTGGEGGSLKEFETGVRVDPQGLLVQLTRMEQTGRLQSLGIASRKAGLNEDMAAPSTLRLVSLTRLEKEVARRLADGKPVLETMKHFAGISEIQYVFVYPEEHEIVIGGPAEGWKYTANGLPVGVNSGRPTLQLDDFVTVLRTFSAGGAGIFNCLIVPREEGLKQVKEFVERSQGRGPLDASSVSGWVSQLQKKLGLQDIEVNGIPVESRVARVIVEADYRMKLIGVGKMSGGSNIPSYFDLLKTTGQTSTQSIDALRWWMTLKCDAVLHSTNRDVFQFQGTSVRCLSENELITDQGQRVHTGKSDATNRLFAENFTKHYAELAARDLVFADLENIFDLSLVAALIEQEQLADRADSKLGVFARGGSYQPAEYAPPQTVDSVVNHRVYKGKDIVVQVAGGVRADLMSIVKDSSIVREASRLASLVSRGRAPNLPEGRWWWDAAH